MGGSDTTAALNAMLVLNKKKPFLTLEIAFYVPLLLVLFLFVLVPGGEQSE
jgi:hypothetical protein